MSSGMELEINVTESVYSPGVYLINDPKYGLYMIPEYDKIRIQKGFARYLAIIIRKVLKRSIKEQKYRGRWVPLSPGYLDFKEKHGLSENIWEATGRLVNSISYRRVGNRYVVGIDPKKYYPGGETKVLTIARCMEYGTRHMPARPLFRPVMRYIKRFIRVYWEAYLVRPDKYIGERFKYRRLTGMKE